MTHPVHILTAEQFTGRTLCGLRRDDVTWTGYRTAQDRPDLATCPDCRELAGLIALPVVGQLDIFGGEVQP